jgi:hypothetical protein
MGPERYEQVYRLFAATCELDSQERAAVLDRECAGDAAQHVQPDASGRHR